MLPAYQYISLKHLSFSQGTGTALVPPCCHPRFPFQGQGGGSLRRIHVEHNMREMATRERSRLHLPGLNMENSGRQKFLMLYNKFSTT